MYVEKMCKNRDLEKCSRIFRPWDLENQDSTVSTTTNEEEGHCCKNEDRYEDESSTGCSSLETKCDEKPSFDTNTKIAETVPNLIDNPPNMFPRVPPFPEFGYYSEMMQANMANYGLVPTDPFLVEHLANGYALEEYARVLEQEHQEKVLNAKKKRPKKYKCPHCDVGFSNNGQLKGHIRIHTGERPFKCDEKDCGKTFTRNEELTRHKRIHSGLRPFPCTQCGKCFGRKDHLKKHYRTHFQPKGYYAVPVMLPYDAWTGSYPLMQPLPSLY